MTAQAEQSTNSILSIRLSTDGFSFSILNPSAGDAPTYFGRDVDPLTSLSANLSRAFDEDERLRLPYRRVNVLMGGGRFTLMPLELFEDEHAESVFHYNVRTKDNEAVMYNVLRSNDLVVIFGVDRTVAETVSRQHPNAKFYAQASPLIDLFAMRSRAGNNRKLYAYVQHSSIGIYAYDRGRLLIGNHFDCTETADHIYYILYAWKELGLDQLRDELWLCGRLTDKAGLLAGLQRHISQVCIMAGPSDHIDLQAATELCG